MQVQYNQAVPGTCTRQHFFFSEHQCATSCEF